MRFHVQPAASADIAYLAMWLEEMPASFKDWPEKEPAERLLETCAFSTQIWAARRVSDGTPGALWGVAPHLDDPSVGYVWMLASEHFDDDPEELETLSRLVLAAMLEEFARLEQHIDSRRDRALSLLGTLGFTIGPPEPQAGTDTALHRVWIEAGQLRQVPSVTAGLSLH